MKETKTRSKEFRLRTLIAALRRVLLSIDLTDLSGRIREIPDERTARFYTTMGLLSPPARLDGRRAMYGKKHLIQLLAIKRLQSQNRPLRDILATLRGAGMAKLIVIAGVDPSILNRAVAEALRDRSPDLWPRASSASSVSPELASTAKARPPSSVVPAQSSVVSSARPLVDESDRSVHTYRVHDGVYLTIDLSAPGASPEEIRNRLIHFAHTFPHSAGPTSTHRGTTP